jgi:TonB family protein
MFSENLLDSSVSRGSALKPRRWLIGVAVIFEAMAAGALVFSPFVSVAALPKAIWTQPEIAVPAGGASAGQVSTARRALPITEPTRAIEILVRVPNLITRDSGATPSASSSPQILRDGLVGFGGSGAGPGIGIPGSTQTIATDVPPPPKPTTIHQIRVSSGVEEARLIYGPKPDYPQLAQRARIEGEVRLEAVINKDGSVGELKVLSGQPLLVRAATDAVARWRYQPTLLNGEPVEVLTEIDVNFKIEE